MKNYIFSLLLGILFIGCASNCKQNQNVLSKYGIKDIYSLLEDEKNYLYGNQIDTIYYIDSLFSYIKNYRIKLVSILETENISQKFDKAFLFEDFFVYKKGVRKSIDKDYPYDYRAVVYFENSKCKTFLDVDISKDCKKYRIDKIRMNTNRDTTIQNWLSKKTEFDRQNLKNGYISQWEDQYDIITKLTEDEKFCRVIINYFWSGFYGISDKPMEKDQIKNWRAIEEIGILMFLTGHGFSF